MLELSIYAQKYANLIYMKKKNNNKEMNEKRLISSKIKTKNNVSYNLQEIQWKKTIQDEIFDKRKKNIGLTTYL